MTERPGKPSGSIVGFSNAFERASAPETGLYAIVIPNAQAILKLLLAEFSRTFVLTKQSAKSVLWRKSEKVNADASFGLVLMLDIVGLDL